MNAVKSIPPCLLIGPFSGQRPVKARLTVHVLTSSALTRVLYIARISILILHVLALSGIEPKRQPHLHHELDVLWRDVCLCSIILWSLTLLITSPLPVFIPHYYYVVVLLLRLQLCLLPPLPPLLFPLFFRKHFIMHWPALLLFLNIQAHVKVQVPLLALLVICPVLPVIPLITSPATFWWLTLRIYFTIVSSLLWDQDCAVRPISVNLLCCGVFINNAVRIWVFSRAPLHCPVSNAFRVIPISKLALPFRVAVSAPVSVVLTLSEAWAVARKIAAAVGWAVMTVSTIMAVRVPMPVARLTVYGHLLGSRIVL